MLNNFVKNDLFDYQNRYIYQLKNGYRFNVDSLLLAEFVKVKYSDKLLVDFCTGNGVIPLVISQYSSLKIVGIDNNNEQTKLFNMSIKENKLDNQLSCIYDDIDNILNYFSHNSVDIITCNPPYFANCKTSINDNKTNSRHNDILNKVFDKSSKILKNKGVLYIVNRVENLDKIIILGNLYNLKVKNIQLIETKKGKEPKILLVKCCKNAKNGLKFNSSICIENLKTYQNIFKELK